jgi:hypothetical protein
MEIWLIFGAESCRLICGYQRLEGAQCFGMLVTTGCPFYDVPEQGSSDGMFQLMPACYVKKLACSATL